MDFVGDCFYALFWFGFGEGVFEEGDDFVVASDGELEVAFFDVILGSFGEFFGLSKFIHWFRIDCNIILIVMIIISFNSNPQNHQK